MIFYTIYNKKLEKFLILPRLGLWYTTEKQIADDLLVACREYANLKITDYGEQFVIIECDKEELCKYQKQEMV